MKNFENSQPNPEAIDTGLEVMKTPEISVNEEPGAQLLSFILKGANPEWGENKSQFARETNAYFQENPLDQEISDFLDEIKALQDGGVDEESLYLLASTYQKIERSEEVFSTLKKYKPWVKNPRELQQRLFELLEMFQKSFDQSSMATKLSAEIEKDGNERQKNIPETRDRIEELIAFFQPDPQTTKIKKISLRPTDPLWKKDSGHASIFGEELVLVLTTNIENRDNLDHEFLHSIINPIIDKVSERLTQEQMDKVSRLANEKLKRDYGDGHFSLLCEELINTYNNIVKPGGKPETCEDFRIKIESVSEKQFQEHLSQNRGFQIMCGELSITTIDDFKAKAKEYFERFEKNRLRDLFFELYQDYTDRPNPENKNFEQFFLNNFIDRI